MKRLRYVRLSAGRRAAIWGVFLLAAVMGLMCVAVLHMKPILTNLAAASVSNTAGTFVCNHLMYGVLYTLAKEYPGVRGGFMHVPFIPEQVVERPAPAPSMNLKDIARGIEAAIVAIGEYEDDIRTAEGQTH